MIRALDIYKRFEDKEVLRGVSAEFETGKTNLIIGTSGSGKTVFVKCLIGLLEPDKGEVYFDNINFSSLDMKERKKIRMQIGMLFQGSALFDSLTVEENVRFPLDMFTTYTAREKLLKVDETLERVNLIGANKKFPSEISGGMMKRVGIARAVIMEPRYLFCDEPNSGLDPKTAIKIDELISELTREKNITTIMNTHDMNSVFSIGEKIIFLHQGLKQWQGSNKEVLHSHDEILNDFIFASDFLKELKKGGISEE